MTDLSPSAQAVTQAIDKVRWDWGNMQEADANIIAAAALRAAADRVVPDDPQEAMHFTTEAIRLNKQGIRQKLLAIAAELEGAR